VKFFKLMALALTLMLLLFGSHARVSNAAAPLPCTENIQEQAKKLLTFHFGEDDRMSISAKVKPIPSLTNPANKTQKFSVYEVWGNIYKGRYRMRFIYYPLQDKSCVLMGQEILEHASL
jgi:hypothetical protein